MSHRSLTIRALRSSMWSLIALGAVSRPAWTQDARLPLTAMRQWSIAVAESAIPAEKYAADEFQKFFRQTTGITLPIHHGARAGGQLFIGPSQALKQSPSALRCNATMATKNCAASPGQMRSRSWVAALEGHSTPSTRFSKIISESAS